MQGLADGYFVIPYTIGDYLAPKGPKKSPASDHPRLRAKDREQVKPRAHRQAAR